jgi:hypothetical protein
MTHSSLTQYVPLWYKLENIGKYNSDVSRQINIDKIQPLPRLSLQASLLNEYGEFELELLSKANAYGLKIPYVKKDLEDFAELEYLVDQYEGLSEDGKFIAEKARIYHIPINEAHLKNIMKLCHEIEDYELLLDSADNAHIDWDTSTYDPEGLEVAVAEANWNFEQQYWDYRNGVLGIYRAGRGV